MRIAHAVYIHLPFIGCGLFNIRDSKQLNKRAGGQHQKPGEHMLTAHNWALFRVCIFCILSLHFLYTFMHGTLGLWYDSARDLIRKPTAKRTVLFGHGVYTRLTICAPRSAVHGSTMQVLVIPLIWLCWRFAFYRSRLKLSLL